MQLPLASLQKPPLPLLKIDCIASLSSELEQTIAATFQQFGFVILECQPVSDPSEDFVKLERYFGRIISHNQSDHRGILPIKMMPDYPAYANCNNLDLALHTDGTFETVPPQVMAMQCRIAAKQGGLSQLVDGQNLYRYLAEIDPIGLKHLFEPNVFTVSRDNQTATHAILENHGDRIHIVFRSDSIAKIAVHAKIADTFERIKTFLADPKNQIIFKLQPDQILIFDNTRMLHGRTGFPPGEVREINGLWFDGNSPIFQGLEFGFFPN